MTTESKPFYTSKTFWAILVAFCGVVVDSSAQIEHLLGVDWAGRVVIGAGLVLAVWGRAVAKGGLTLALLAACMVGVGGCAQQRVGGVREAVPVGYRSEGAVSNVLTVDAQGQTTQEYAAEPPAAVIAGAAGVENYGAVPFGSVSVQLPDGTLLVASVPNDFGADTVEITHADGETVKLSGVTVSTSQVVLARASFLTQMLPIISVWTDAQKQALIAELEAQAALGDSFAKSILPFVQALVTGG